MLKVVQIKDVSVSIIIPLVLVIQVYCQLAVVVSEAGLDRQLSGCIIITQSSVSVRSDVFPLMASTQPSVHRRGPLLGIIPQFNS